MSKNDELQQARKEYNMLMLAYDGLSGGGINHHPSGTLTKTIDKLSASVEKIARLEQELAANA